MRRKTLPRQSAHIVDLISILWGKFQNIRKGKVKACSAGTSSNKNSDCPARKCFRCGCEDHTIAKCPKPPKDSEKRRKYEKSKEKLIMRATPAMMTMPLKYTHLWHKYLIKTNTKVKIMAIV